MKTAKFIKNIQFENVAEQKLWGVVEDGVQSYVVTSAITPELVRGLDIHETYIFPADETGEITEYVEMEGSFEGGADHEEALRRGGYTVVQI